MTSRDLLLCSGIREGSTRCKEKMIRPFGNTTLADLFLMKLDFLREMGNSPFSDIVIGIYPGDTTLYKIAKKYDVTIIDRDKSSATIVTKANEILNFVEDYPQSHMMWVNGSAPFIKVHTLHNIGKFFLDNKDIESIHLVKDLRNWIWENGQRINVDNLSLTRVQEAKPLLQSVHVLHLYNKQFMFETGAYWRMKPNDPFLYKVDDTIEFMDIDTELDFKICESIYKSELWLRE